MGLSSSQVWVIRSCERVHERGHWRCQRTRGVLTAHQRSVDRQSHAAELELGISHGCGGARSGYCPGVNSTNEQLSLYETEMLAKTLSFCNGRSACQRYQWRSLDCEVWKPLLARRSDYTTATYMVRHIFVSREGRSMPFSCPSAERRKSGDQNG